MELLKESAAPVGRSRFQAAGLTGGVHLALGRFTCQEFS